ncbi:hypothetical protein GCM10027346_38870 [Hymenobacter seoulensis]
MRPLPPAHTAVSFPRETLILRMLYGELLKLSAPVPYREARLRRIANQLEYVLLSWPADRWPEYSVQGNPVPAPAALLQRLVNPPPLGGAQQQHLLDIVRLLI